MKKLWIGFWAVIILSFAVLGWTGTRIYQEKPPIPSFVELNGGGNSISSDDVTEGQVVWQSMGGMESGSIWGHGSYVAPDWTADWLHRECVFVLNEWATHDFSLQFEQLSNEQQAALRARLTTLMRTNTYNAESNTVTLDPIRFRAFQDNLDHYTEVYTKGNARYAIAEGALTDPVKLRQLAAFFFWTSWAASTDRPGQEITYTSNWPHEELIGNVPTADAIVWTGVSIIVLLAGIGGMVWYNAKHREEIPHIAPEADPLFHHVPTPSQIATIKYFLIVSALMGVQVLLGILTAHYGVEGDGFYGMPIQKYIPYVVTRTWHTQIGIFWIATAWLAAGLYVAPAVSGYEPKFQRLGVNVLFSALLLIVVGSLAGEWMSIYHKMTGDQWFWFGHQGFEYVDLGRVWQIGLIIGLTLWVILIGRCIIIGMKKNTDQRPLLTLFVIAAVAIGGFYGAGLMIGKHTHLAMAEYWRWWVVHLWVEGFFEVFATVIIAFMFTRLGLLSIKAANTATIFSSTIFLSGGIIGTLHHLYYSGTPTVVLALGSVFSALEVVPLTLVGYDVWEHLRLSRSTRWAVKYKWPVYFFISVAFWNLVGAGLFGFMINPPIALFYMQGLNTTPVHGHAALFGVYGMLGIGLMLFCLRMLTIRLEWPEKLLKFGFWSLNIGLFAMVVISLLPVGLLQTWASVKYGYWYARSSDFLYSPLIQSLKWTRAFGDTIFAMGTVAIVSFVFMIVIRRFQETKKM